MKRWAALLKGVNVGGNHKLPMAELRALCEAAGLVDVKTLLASGNVVFSAKGSADTVRRTLESALAAHGCATDALLRDAQDLDAVIAANPFADAARDHPSHLLVVFHGARVPQAPLDTLAQSYLGPERLQAVGSELFIDYPEDIGHSKLASAMAKAKFPKLATGRNWNTVLKLRAMLDG